MDDDYLLIGWARELRDLSYFPSLHMNTEFTLKKLLFKLIFNETLELSQCMVFKKSFSE